MCVIVQKKYIALMLLRAYRAAELRLNMLKDNIEMNSNKMARISMRAEINLSIFNIKISDINNDIW
jgi:hypothetical protein